MRRLPILCSVIVRKHPNYGRKRSNGSMRTFCLWDTHTLPPLPRWSATVQKVLRPLIWKDVDFSQRVRLPTEKTIRQIRRMPLSKQDIEEFAAVPAKCDSRGEPVSVPA